MAKSRKKRESEPAPVQDWSTIEKRIAWLLDSKYHGNKSLMSKRLDLTNMVLTRVLAGQRPPGPRLVRAIIERLGVNSDWLLHGRGEPFPGAAAGRGARKRVPVFNELLPGRLTGSPEQQAKTWVDVQELLSPTQYWFYLSSNQPLLAVEKRGFHSGDLILLESDPTRFPLREQLWERLCVVKNPHGKEPPVKLGLVSYFEASIDTGPAKLEVDTFDSAQSDQGVVEEFVFRRYPGGELRSHERKLRLERTRRGDQLIDEHGPESEPVLPEIVYGNIVAVWTGILLRNGYGRLA